MRIAVISTTIFRLPPIGYSGLEMIAWQQATGLAKKGHEVLLVAPVGSKTSERVDLHGTTVGESEMQAYSGYWEKLLKADAVIDNSWQKWAYMLKAEGKLKAPVLGVMHTTAESMYASAPPVEKPCIVAISKDQAGAIMGQLGIRTRIAYNGADPDFYMPTKDKRTERYLFLGRMSKLKGPHIAALAAHECNVSLDLVGDDRLVEDPGYVLRVKSLSKGNQVVYHGEKPRSECPTYFSTAKAMLHCNAVFREPFGLAPVEAMLCGAPVIAWNHGATRETIKNGETGFLVDTYEDLTKCLVGDAVRSIKSEACREWASQFSVRRMVDRYEELCKEAVDQGW